MKGTVEAIGTKFNKFSVMVDGNWYGTKEEWAPDPRPERGDVIEFDAKGGKYLNNCKIVSKGGPSGGSTGGGSKGFSTLGVELGHAANLGMTVTLAETSPTSGDFWEKFSDNTDAVFKIMKVKRELYEKGDSTPTEAPKQQERMAPSPTNIDRQAAEDIF